VVLRAPEHDHHATENTMDPMDLRAPRIDDLSLEGKRVLIRVDFNVPEDDDGNITDDTRIRASLPTIREVLAKGGKPILMSHFGRPKGKVVEDMRLTRVGERLAKLLGTPVRKLDEIIGPAVKQAIDAAPKGTTILLENVRFHAGEEKADPVLSAELAKLGDVFINDAFGSSHRDHSSVCGVARLLPSAAGRLMEKEIAAFARVLEKPAQPFVAILGGAKVSDKLKVIDNLLERVNALLVGGGMAYTFLKARDHRIGKSLVQDDQIDLVLKALMKAERMSIPILLPEDHVCADRFAADAKPVTTGIDIPDDLMGLDIGPKTRERYRREIANAKTIVWNGPMGVFEMPAFRAGTEAVARAVSESEGYTVIGGGDSVAAIEMFGLAPKIDHISTGGGASLELLEGILLPGIAALQRGPRRA
jgi:phosphoglycerate kinase